MQAINARPLSAKIAILGLAIVLAVAMPARADQRYVVTGDDSYRIGSPQLQTTISYSGAELLTVRHAGGAAQFSAKARYTRADASGKVVAHASFVQVMSAQGQLEDRSDADPDYLTILNQPFAVQLDEATRGSLFHLQGRIPFLFPAPMTGGKLRGLLARGTVGRVASRIALGVSFDAVGPMRGPLPDHPHLSISGTIRMRGTAYYALQGDAILLALEETLTISGTLRDRGQPAPVTIVYRRTIKADNSGPSMTEAGGT